MLANLKGVKRTKRSRRNPTRSMLLGRRREKVEYCTFKTVRKLGASALEELKGLVVVSNSLSAGSYSQRPVRFRGTHLSSPLVQWNSLFRHVHLRIVNRQPTNHFQV